MRVKIRDLQRQKRINLPELEKKIIKVCQLLHLSQKEVHLVLGDNRLIKKLNRDFLGKNHPTDVLAFPLEDEYSSDILGEIVVSVEEAEKNSKIYRTSFKEELALYIIHGILHLIGYKDYKARDREKMRKKEEELLSQIKNLNSIQND